jgi:predicted MFS family arabinose efflux permease
MHWQPVFLCLALIAAVSVAVRWFYLRDKF